MKRQLLLLCLLLVAGIQTVFSQKYSNEFLAIGVGARAHGMSGAQTAFVNDISAAYWNPAGLSEIEAPFQVGAMHAEWFAGVGQYDYLSFGKSLNRDHKSYLAFSLIRLGIDNIPYTINLVNTDGTINYENVTEFSAADYALFGSYGRKLKNPAFSVGGSVKVVRRVIGSIGSAWGFGADLGAQYRKGNVMIGVMGRDLTTTFNAWSFNLTEREKAVFDSTKNEIPVSNTEITKPRFIFGGAYKVRLGQKVTMMPAIDLEWTTDGQRNVLINSKSINIDPRIGLETDYDGFVQLRLGIANFQRVKDDFNPDKENLTFQPNFGVGLRLGRIQLDYALTDIGNQSAVAYSHIFSLKLDFKERKKSSE
ncbi:MAG: PorV/PorQ family protein [Saprospiraceae bacterium]|nr:PorV/PorQ family protein [Saprospiraceae bacterium]